MAGTTQVSGGPPRGPRGGARPFEETASRGRRLLHALLALAGWALFIRFWLIVMTATPPEAAARGVLVLSLILLLAVAATLAWVRHNVRLYRRRAWRRSPPEARADFRSDALGRRVDGPEWEAVRGAPEVEIAVDGRVKSYRIF